jgi:hypothetical protein
MAVDYLKTYLGIDPNDYSSMEARIRGEEPQARTPVMMRQPMMMPQQRSLGDIEAMQLIPRQQPAPQVDDRYQGLTDQIVALKSQIEGMQAPQPAPQVDERYQGLMDQIAALRSQIEGMQAPVVEEAPVMAPTPAVVEAPTPAPAVMSEPFQAPPEIENRMVGEPEPFVAQEPVLAPTPALDIPQAPAEDIQASINYLASLPKMNIPQIPDIEEIKRKMAEANMNFPEPVSYPDQLQAIRDLPPMNQMPTREEIQMAMQNIPVPEKAFTPAQTIQEKIQAVMQNIPVPETSIYTSPNNSRKNTSGNTKYANAYTRTNGLSQHSEVFFSSTTNAHKRRNTSGNPKYSCTSTSIYTSPNNSRKNTSGNTKYACTNTKTRKQVNQDKYQNLLQDQPKQFKKKYKRNAKYANANCSRFKHAKV